MKARIYLVIAAAFISVAASAQIGKPFIHDPSTIAECDGKYYTFGTGGGGLISEDGWTWESGAVRPGGGAAPDVVKIGDRYLVGYSATGGGLGGGHAGRILVMWNKTLDPNSPDFAYSDPIEVAHSEMDEDCDAIDIGLFLDPTTGRLWCTYGTYFGAIRIVELDPKTGERVKGNIEKDVAIDCEASDMIYHNGWYYLLGTHGTCCDGTNSTYNIVCGRSRNVTGPFYDNMGRDMMAGGGKMVIAAENRRIGAGHFGRTIVTEGVEKMSLHWEADMDQSGRSVLAIRPIVWVNDWPVSGELWQDGKYAIISQRRGYALELAVDFVRLAGGMRGFGGQGNDTVIAIEDQKLEDVIGGWPKGDIEARIGDIMYRPHQKWSIEAVQDVPGYLGGQYCKIVIDGTNRALAAAPGAEVITVPEFTGAPEQLWRIDQLTDGTYRIMPKEVPGEEGEFVLISAGDSTPSLGKFNFESDNCKWNLKKW
ncbi:MAG: family 43 glycosylhydrolase [Bacteroidales bacterium]|nr:family 43 glycosylhydrolase [Bacteroidales bacterium]MBQ3984879.1 family 43 glycosylhydrolase [Bacteroidales bacterium]MBQ4189378.1 family 43 glycosylhydrolase [Bacteroidales bacterium]MBQ5417244.1 family 43 glycosylhydrolase [Bacteroidales bacterium]